MYIEWNVKDDEIVTNVSSITSERKSIVEADKKIGSYDVNVDELLVKMY